MKVSKRKLFLALFIFLLSVTSYYFPIQKKGHEWGADYLNLIEARNLAESDVLRSESDLGIILSSDDIKEKGVDKGVMNPLTPIIYSWIFHFWGFNIDIPIFISIITISLFNALLFLLIAKILSLRAGFLGALFVVLMPAMVSAASYAGYYEFALLFLVIALWLYFGNKENLFNNSIPRIFLASVFFALAALSRNAFATAFLPFLLFDFWVNRSWKRALALFLPFVFIFGLTLTSYSWLGMPNGYKAEADQQPFQQIGHFFPDPYTYHFEKDTFLEDFFKNTEPNRVNTAMAVHYGYDVSFLDKLGAYMASMKFYIFLLISFTMTGGPLVVFFMLLGVISLWKEKYRRLALFVLLWLFVWFLYLVYARSGNWNHILEISFVVAVLGGVGLNRLLVVLNAKKFLTFIIVLLFVGHMGYASKWRLFDVYRSSKVDETKVLVQKTNELNASGNYAIGVHPEVTYAFNYYTNKNAVYFNPRTVENLIKDDNLDKAIEIYDLNYFLGYPGIEFPQKYKRFIINID